MRPPSNRSGGCSYLSSSRGSMRVKELSSPIRILKAHIWIFPGYTPYRLDHQGQECSAPNAGIGFQAFGAIKARAQTYAPDLLPILERPFRTLARFQRLVRYTANNDLDHWSLIGYHHLGYQSTARTFQNGRHIFYCPSKGVAGQVTDFQPCSRSVMPPWPTGALFFVFLVSFGPCGIDSKRNLLFILHKSAISGGKKWICIGEVLPSRL